MDSGTALTIVSTDLSAAADLARLTDRACAAEAARAAECVSEAIKSGHKMLFCGNGGSAADAQHLAAEFVGRFLVKRRPMPAVALTTDSSILTAIGNDNGFDNVFSRQVEALGTKGDVLICLSTSGLSRNVLEAAQTAREAGITVVSFCGEDAGLLRPLSDIVISVPSRSTPHIQEMHAIIGHAMVHAVEQSLFG
jgi:D-sedoheptulose 7-phosphate isomerase